MHQSKGGTWHAFLDHRTKLRANRRQNPSRRHFRPCLLLASRRRDLRLRGNAGRKNPRVTIGALAIGPISHHRQNSKSLAGDAVTSLRRRRAARLFRRIRCERGHGPAALMRFWAKHTECHLRRVITQHQRPHRRRGAEWRAPSKESVHGRGLDYIRIVCLTRRRATLGQHGRTAFCVGAVRIRREPGALLNRDHARRNPPRDLDRQGGLAAVVEDAHSGAVVDSTADAPLSRGPNTARSMPPRECP